MICSMLEMRLKPGSNDALVKHFKDERIFERAMDVDGCHDVVMLHRDEQVLVMAWWDDADAYQRWIDHPERNSNSDMLSEHLAEPITETSVGRTFDVVLAATPRGQTPQ